jgi:hypothetical protein
MANSDKWINDEGSKRAAMLSILLGANMPAKDTKRALDMIFSTFHLEFTPDYVEEVKSWHENLLEYVG